MVKRRELENQTKADPTEKSLAAFLYQSGERRSALIKMTGTLLVMRGGEDAFSD